MAEFLFLVENKEKAEMVTAIAGDRIEVVVVDRAPASFSINAQVQGGGAAFVFQPISSVWSPLLKRISRYTDVYYGFDTCMEGEYVSYLVDQLLLISAPQVQGHRLHIAGLSKEIVLGAPALVEPLRESRCVLYLQYTLFHKVFFAHLLRLLGTNKGPGGVLLSVPVLAILSMLSEKHQSLSRVVRKQKWEVGVCCQDGVLGRLTEVYGISSDGFLDSGNGAKKIAKTIKGGGFSFVDNMQKEVIFPSPMLYTLAELVLDAYLFFKVEPSDALAGLQELYLGVDCGHGKVGLITPPCGTSSQNIQPVFRRLVEFVLETYGEHAKPKDDFGDEVILPLDCHIQPDEVSGSTILHHLYELIWSRAIASQMTDGLASEQKNIFELDGKRILLSSLTLVQKGFMAVFAHGYDTVFSAETLRPYGEGDVVVVEHVMPQHIKYQGAAQYTIVTLCEEMRELGFDDENQIIRILQEMLVHHYIILSGTGELICADTLFKVTATVDRAFPGMTGVSLPAYYGQTLEEVVTGRKRLDVALKQFDQNLMMHGKPLVKVKVPVSVPQIKRKSRNVIKGGGGAVSRVGNVIDGFEDFSAESDDPEVDKGLEEVVAPVVVEDIVTSESSDRESDVETVDVVNRVIEEEDASPVVPEVLVVPEEPEDINSEPIGPTIVSGGSDETAEAVFEQPEMVKEEPEKIEISQVEEIDLSTVETKACPECGRDMVVKDDRFGKFWSCTGLPACHHSETYQQKKKGASQQSCPVCRRGALSVSRTPAGKSMYMCSDPTCEFMAWSKPYPIDCPLCGSSFLIQKKDRRGNTSLRCPMAGCSYIHGGEEARDAGPKPKKKMVRVRRKKSASSGGKKRRVVRRRRK